MNVVGVTGHRSGMGFRYRSDQLDRFALASICSAEPDLIITGMAVGWDQAVAAGAARLGIPFIAAVPFPGQADPWPDRARRHYEDLLTQAAEVVEVTSERPYSQKLVTKAMHTRNQFIVDRANQILALYNGGGGGTGHCIKRAQIAKVPVTNVWELWKNSFVPEKPHVSL
jgi:uncharacterized phage-like protein YoqJ